MAKKQDIPQEPEKSVEELAREAMDAIKQHERAEELKQEEIARQELHAKEEALKQEVRNKLKRKLRELRKQEEKEAKVEEVDTRFMVSWKNPDKAGNLYIGEYNEKEMFRISRGISIYHLRITGKDMIYEEWRKNGHTSVELDNLKKKADQLLKESIKKTKELKDKKK